LEKKNTQSWFYKDACIYESRTCIFLLPLGIARIAFYCLSIAFCIAPNG